MSVRSEYPTKLVRLITGAPGGGIDFATRLIAEGLARRWGQSVTVQNVPAGSMAEMVAKAPADGYTLLMTGKIMWLTPYLQDQVPYDPILDFAPITLAVRSPNILVVNSALPVTSVSDLIALAQTSPGTLRFTSSGSGASTHLAGELFKAMAGVDIVHAPCKGNVAAIAAVAANEAQLMFSATTAAQSGIRSGELRALAVTSPQRSALFPELPTVATSGVPEFESESILGLFAPAKTERAIVADIRTQTVGLLQEADIKARLLSASLEAAGTSGEELTATMKSEMARLGGIISKVGLRD